MDRSDLQYIRVLNDKIQGALLHIEELRSKAFPGAISYDDSGASKAMPVNKLELVFELVDKEERRLNRLIDKRYAAKTGAIKAIQSAGLETAERHVLYLRYLATDPRTGQSLEWPDVFRYVNRYHNIQEKRIYQLHHNAVAKLKNHNI